MTQTIQSAALSPHLRVAARLAANFLLETVQIVSAGRDLTDMLILVAAVQANTAPILTDPVLQRRYAAMHQTPPRELRRPVSINALAASLGLSFETVRRRVRALVAQGWCEVTSAGVVVPEARLDSPEHRQALEANYQAVRKLYIGLRVTGCLAPPPATPADPDPAPPVRAVARLSAEFALRMVDPIIAVLGDLTDGFVLMAVLSINTAHLPAGQEPSGSLNEDGFVDDALRRPASVSQIAAMLNLPYERIRRRIRRLEREGRCEVGVDGVILPAAAFLRTGMAEFMTRNQANLQRLFAGVGQLGLIPLWERDVAASAGAGVDQKG